MGDPTAAKLLQALVGQILLRRTKDSTDKSGKKLVDLPPIEYFQVPVRLDDETRELYDEVLRASTEALLTGQVSVETDSQLTSQSTANVLSMLTRSKCDHQGYVRAHTSASTLPVSAACTLLFFRGPSKAPCRGAWRRRQCFEYLRRTEGGAHREVEAESSG